VLSTCFISLKNYVETLKKEVLLAGNAAQEMREYASRPGERLLQMAQNYFGTPYTEMDCSTFVRVVARDAGMPVKRVDPKKPYVHTTDYWFNEGLGDHFKAMKFGASEEISIKQVIEAASANPRKIPPGSVLISQKQRLGDGAERSGHAAFFVGVTKYDKDQNSQIMIYDSNAVESNMGRVADPQAKILLGNPQGVGPHVSTLHWNPEAMVKVFLPLPPPKTPPKSSPRAAEASSGGRLLASPA